MPFIECKSAATSAKKHQYIILTSSLHNNLCIWPREHPLCSSSTFRCIRRRRRKPLLSCRVVWKCCWVVEVWWIVVLRWLIICRVLCTAWRRWYGTVIGKGPHLFYANGKKWVRVVVVALCMRKITRRLAVAPFFVMMACRQNPFLSPSDAHMTHITTCPAVRSPTPSTDHDQTPRTN